MKFIVQVVIGFVRSFTAAVRQHIRRIYLTIRNKVILLNNKRRIFIRVEKRNKIPRLIISEKYEQLAKWILRVITLSGIFLSLVSLRLYWSLTISIFLVVIEQIVEKIVFQYISIFIQPFPTEWDDSKWLAMVRMQVGSANYIGLLIETEDQAKKLFECLRAWNYERDEDIENNIVVSFVLEREDMYTAFIYPSFRREVIKEFKEQADYEMFKRKKLKEQQQVILSMCFCKEFQISSMSSIYQFIKDYRNGTPYALTVLFRSSPIDIHAGLSMITRVQDSPIQPVEGIRPIIKRHIKVRKRGELTASDFEFQYSRLIMRK